MPSGSSPYGAVDSDVYPALIPLASQQAVAISTTVTAPVIDRGTVFPSSPTDKQEFVYVADAVNWIEWRFKYNSGDSGANKWHFNGGPPLVVEVVAEETTTSTSYAALATGGPAIILPFAGDYDVLLFANAWQSTPGSAVYMSYDIGGTGAVDADSVEIDPTAQYATLGRPKRKTGLSAVTLTAKYKVGAGTGHIRYRYMAVTPVRVTG